MHRTLLNAFLHGKAGVSRNDDDAAGVLFRVDQNLRENLIVVLVQSKTAPDWAFLNDERDAHGHAYLLPASMIGDGKSNPALMEFDLKDKIRAGQRLAFRLRANPTKRLGKSAGDDKGKRVGIYDEDKQLEWLCRKAEAGSFRIIRALVSREGDVRDTIHRGESTDELKLFSVQFDGLLQVLDPEQMRMTVVAGIGSGKGFGFGLLSLAPA